MSIKKILCIEDDRFIGEMYVRSLKKAGYDVEWVADGNDGLIKATQEKFDLMLLDIMLPEKRGVEILQALRSDNKYLIPDTKVIVMTNFDQDDDTKAEMMKHADGYLIKAEITPRALLNIIDKL